MENVGNMLSSARENRRRQLMRMQAHRHEVLPTTVPQPSAPQRSGYTALMRSHDRVHTRHIAGKSKANGA